MAYRYFINSTEVFPINAGTEKYTYEPKNDADIVLEKKLNSDLIFHYTDSGFDFKLQESINISEELNFQIINNCALDKRIEFEGLFAVCEGEFDDNLCLFTVRPRKKEFILNDVDVNVYSGYTQYLPGGVFTSDRNYVNAFDFGSVLYCVAKTTNPRINSVISNFFQINPDGPFYLPGVTNKWDALALCSLSDVQEPVPSNPATFERIKFSELMNDLNVLFDVYWYIDENYNLRVEHSAFFDGTFGLNLNELKYRKYINGKTKYSYDLQGYPDKERWTIVSNGRAQYAELTYNQISDLSKQINQVGKSTTKIRTDYVSIRYDGKNSTDDGFFLFATELIAGQYTMYGDGGVNYALTPYYLVTNLHTYNRPYLYALFESFERWIGQDLLRNGAFIAKTTAKLKKYEPIEIPLCCDDDFNTQDVIRTPMGYGKVDKAAFDAKTNTLSLELKYENRSNYYITPNMISGLSLWLKSDEGVTYNNVTNKISQWNDFSGNSRHATQANASFQPTYDPVAKKIILAKPNFLQTPSFQMFPGKRGTAFILFEIGNQTAGAQMNYISTNDGTASNFYDFSFQGASLENYSQSYFYPPNFFLGDQSGLYYISRYDDDKEFYKQNGVIPFNNSIFNPATIPNVQPTAKPLIIGYNANNGAVSDTTTLFPSKLLEIIIYNRVLTDMEVKNIEFYFAKKGTMVIYPITF